MTTSASPPEPKPERSHSATRSVLKTIGLLLAMVAISVASAFGVFYWQVQKYQQSAIDELEALRVEQQELTRKIALVEQAAAEAKLLFDENGDLVTLETKLKEIDNLKLALKKAQEENQTQLKKLEDSVVKKVTEQGKETAQAVSQELRWKNILVKAQGEVLLTQVHWAEGNQGLAKDELEVASKTLKQALEEAPDSVKPGIEELVDEAEQAKTALILEQPSARDALNLLWHHVSELLTTSQ